MADKFWRRVEKKFAWDDFICYNTQVFFKAAAKDGTADPSNVDFQSLTKVHQEGWSSATA